MHGTVMQCAEKTKTSQLDILLIENEIAIKV